MIINNSKFTIDNIPFGIFSIKNAKKRLATIINDQVVDLYALADFGYFDDLKIKKSVFKNDYLNDFIRLSVKPLSRQINATDTTLPAFSATKRLDIELEMATIIGKSNPIGDSIYVNEAEDYFFGFTLFNDWSTRDIQRWEYVPLGPFLGKNFFSSMWPGS